MAAQYSELELRIQWLDRGVYFVGGKYIDTEQDRENDILDPVRVAIDLPKLRDLALDPDAYGAALSQMLFGNPGDPIHEAFLRARVASAARDGLRIRLHVQASAPELHALHWELIHEPGTGKPLLASPTIWFSRFLSTGDLRLHPLQDPDSVQVLVVVANPSDLSTKWNQPALNADHEFEAASQAIRSQLVPGVRRIAIRRLEKHATVYNLVSDMRESYSDVVYLACHGTLTADGEPRLLLEDEDGLGEMVKGEQLVERIAAANERPRLVILASCQSAGSKNGEGLGALAPRLAQAGVPNVLAMRGDVTLASVARFMPRLFRELVDDGQIDRAVAAARADIGDQRDWWMPALYTHSRSGALWPARNVDAESFDRWDAVVGDLQDGRCVPVLGPGLVESVFGSTRAMAREWAERYEFPLAPRNRDDLAQVAQYLAYQQSRAYVLRQLRGYLTRYLRREFPDRLPPDLKQGPVREGLVDELISHIGAAERVGNPSEVHKLLAKLPVAIYVNANRDNMLHDALVEAGRKPHVQLCTWRSLGDRTLPQGPVPEPKYKPSAAEPLIFHVFGNFQYPESLVMTEDDYFDFLTAVTRNEARNLSIPLEVSRALASSGLMLLGFQMDAWDFRVLFSSIVRQPGIDLSRMRTRVAIQMSPDEAQSADPSKTYQYLRNYFRENARINLFWGSPEEFMVKLIERFEDETD
jgi:hypothetical protein